MLKMQNLEDIDKIKRNNTNNKKWSDCGIFNCEKICDLVACAALTKKIKMLKVKVCFIISYFMGFCRYVYIDLTGH